MNRYAPPIFTSICALLTLMSGQLQLPRDPNRKRSGDSEEHRDVRPASRLVEVTPGPALTG